MVRCVSLCCLPPVMGLSKHDFSYLQFSVKLVGLLMDVQVRHVRHVRHVIFPQVEIVKVKKKKKSFHTILYRTNTKEAFKVCRSGRLCQLAMCSSLFRSVKTCAFIYI